jgi:acylphosphatase
MTYHIFVSGRVQGVGYRRFAKRQAEALSLKGWARNLWDGRVEVFAVGPESQLDRFCEELKRGPSFSQVREVIVKTMMDEGDGVSSNEFEIRPDPELR